MTRLWDILLGRTAPRREPSTGAVTPTAANPNLPQPASPPAAPTIILPRTFQPTDRPQIFDPALKHIGNAFRPGDPTFPDPETGRRWAESRRRATDHVLRRIAESAYEGGLILRGGRLMPLWAGAAAREPGDLDFLVDPPTVRPDEPHAASLQAGLTEAVLTWPVPSGITFDPNGVASEDIWTYERAPGRRVVYPWRADGLPGGAVQVDVVFGETPAERPVRASVPLADGGCVTVWAAGPTQSLAWKLLWLAADWYPQGKDLYDAVLLAERTTLSREMLERTFQGSDTDPIAATAAEFVRYWRADWKTFRAEYPWVEGELEAWRSRLAVALAPTFGGPDRPPAEPLPWQTPTVIGLAEAIAAGAFDRLPVLADALEEAGCTDPDVLTHCRANGPHGQGCWVVERVLGAG